MNDHFRVMTADPLHVQIERYMRQQIQTGKLSPDERLPPTAELAQRWGVHLDAVQRAMSRLVAEGLIERKPGRGTFVKTATDKAVVGLLLGINLLDESAVSIRALAEAVRVEIHKCGWSCRVYDRLSYLEREETTESCQHLIKDIHNYGFKGLVVIAVRPGFLKDEALRMDLPKVLLGGAFDEGDVRFDTYGFARSAVQYLVAKGRRRIVYLRTSGLEHGQTRDKDGFLDAASASGLKLTGESIQQVEGFMFRMDTFPLEQLGYAQMKQLMAKWDSSAVWPDGLIVSDDVIMKGVARALSESGVEVPERIVVVTVAHEGIHHPYSIPVVRFEFSPREIARHLVAALQKKILREPQPESPILAAARLKQEDLEPTHERAMP